MKLFAFAAILSQVFSQCQVHKEWRELTTAERAGYFRAVKCMRDAPSETPDPRSRSRWDDFVVAHATAMFQIHNTPSFLPWHRVMLSVFEKAMRNCGYTGAMPYWDWAFDSQQPGISPVFNPYRVDSSNCVSMYGVGPLTSRYPEVACVQRNRAVRNTQFSDLQMQQIREQGNYNRFRIALESLAHNAIHALLGGDMAIVTESPNDPLFFLHHQNVDREWYMWQQRNPSRRMQYSGANPGGSIANSNNVMIFSGLYRNLRVVRALDSTIAMPGLSCFTYSNSITTTDMVPENNNTIIQKRNLANIPLAMGIRLKRRKHYAKIKCPDKVPDDFLSQFNYTSNQLRKIKRAEAVIEKFTNWVNDNRPEAVINLRNPDEGKFQGIRPRTNQEMDEDDATLHNLYVEFNEQIDFAEF